MSLLPRIHFFEFVDQPWLKGEAREAYVGGLTMIHRLFGPYSGAAEPLRSLSSEVGSADVLDLGSGSGEHIRTLLADSDATGCQLPRIILSDLFPQLPAYEALKASFSGVDYISTPVSAFDSPESAPKVRSIFTAFHHFSPQHAKQLIEDAFRKGDGLFIAEFNERSIIAFLTVVLCSPTLLLTPFFFGRFSWAKLLLCFPVPLIPLMLLFDGVVSNFRVYTRADIQSMLDEIGLQDVELQCGSRRHRFATMNFISLRRRNIAQQRRHA